MFIKRRISGLRNKLSSGQILFNPPEEMKVGIEERVEVRLTNDITENLTEELKAFKRFIESHWQWIVATIISAIAVIPIILKLGGRTRKK
jgi:hypothetical protein